MKQFQEVAPPGWGHTKSDKEKGVEKGGSAAAFDRARKEGRFKGSKEDMFKLMWWMKNKGGKPKGEPHYKPGTDEKKKKYQDEDWKPEIEVIDTKKEAKKREKKRKEAESSLPPHLRLDTMKKAFAHTNESFEIDKTEHKKKQKERKMRNLAIKNPNENESNVAHKKAGGPKLYGEGAAWTKKSGKNPEGGLNEKGRKSYERDNPGSDLKAPQPEGGSRKKSFCARMGGMKKKLTNSKTANDPDSRINKALRKWKCNEESKGLYANIHAKRKRGERPAKPGEKGYPKPGAFASAEKTTKEELAFEGWQDRAKEAMRKVAGKKPIKNHDYGRDAGKVARELMRKKDHQTVNFLDPDD